MRVASAKIGGMKEIEPLVDEKNFGRYSPSRAVNFTVGWTMVAHHVSLDVVDITVLVRLNIGSNRKKLETKASGYRQRRKQTTAELRAE
jgi:hypothetical protein